MEAIEWFTSILVVIVSVFFIVITIMAHVEIKKGQKETFSLEVSTIGQNTTGRIVYFWLMILVGLVGAYYGASHATYILMASALISERLIIYRACRPNDRLGKFLTKYNW